jgi:Flp pilus assembly protein TadD
MTTTHSEFENSTLHAGQRQDSTLEIQVPDGSAVRSPGQVHLLFEEARACWRARREAEAFGLMQKVLSQDPENPEALSFFGLCLAKLYGEHARALDICTAAVARSPESAEVRTNLGRVQLLAGANGAAHRSFVLAYRQDPGNPAIAAELASMGVRRPTALPFLERSHWCNRILGRARHGFEQIVAAVRNRSSPT